MNTLKQFKVVCKKLGTGVFVSVETRPYFGFPLTFVYLIGKLFTFGFIVQCGRVRFLALDNKIMKYATLVYQAGIANVFSHEVETSNFRDMEELKASRRVRLMQGDFRTCEAYVRGLRDAGVTVRSAWCNEAGDIINSFWNFQNLEDAPFSDKFSQINFNCVHANRYLE